MQKLPEGERRLQISLSLRPKVIAQATALANERQISRSRLIERLIMLEAGIAASSDPK